MHNLHYFVTWRLAALCGAISTLIGGIAFALHWTLWDVWGGPMPGINILLFPGNVTLVYLWHPLFSEELGFWPKFMLQMLGQFSVVTAFFAIIFALTRRFKQLRYGIKTHKRSG